MINFSSYKPDESNVVVVELSGRLDTDTADLFFARLEEEVRAGNINLIFDCSKLEHISSLGFGMMIRAHSRLQKEGGAVRFARLEGMIAEAFQIVGFHKLFDNHPSVAAAAASIES
ncbi:MAG: STAS domain-containing protein [Planctomycetaceae bacterium]